MPSCATREGPSDPLSVLADVEAEDHRLLDVVVVPVLPLAVLAQHVELVCNIFPGPDLEHKLDVLREHCERENRDYDDIEKTVVFRFDVGEHGERVAQTIAELRSLASLGIEVAHGSVKDLWKKGPLEVIGQEVIPAVADL